MSNNTPKRKSRFVFMSLLWSALLYISVMCVLNWRDITGNSNNASIVYTKASEMTSVSISIDSLQKRMNITGAILKYLHIPIK